MNRRGVTIGAGIGILLALALGLCLHEGDGAPPANGDDPGRDAGEPAVLLTSLRPRATDAPPESPVADVRTIHGIVHDKAEKPLGRLRLGIGESMNRKLVEVVSDAEGRFTFEARTDGPYRVTFDAGVGNPDEPSFIGFRNRETRLVGGELRVLINRNPRVRLRGRMEGHPNASMESSPAFRRRVDIEKRYRDPRGEHTVAHGLHVVVTPGRWAFDIARWGVTTGTITTPDLGPDDEVDIDCTVTPAPDMAVLKVIPNAPGVGPEERIDLRVEMCVPDEPGFTYRAYDTPEALIVTEPGTYRLRALLRVGQTVWLSDLEEVALQEGTVREVVLAMESAVPVHVEALPPERSGGEFLSMKGPRAGDERPFRFHKPGSVTPFFGARSRYATWWCRPGHYKLKWFTNRSDREVVRPFTLEAGESAYVTWTETDADIEVR